MKLQGIDFQGLAALAALGLGAWVVWRVVRAAPAAADAVAGTVRDAAAAVGTAVNPADSGNLVNRGVTAAGAAVSGDSSWTLGGWWASVTGADRDAEIRAMLDGRTVPTWQGRVGYHDPVYGP